MATAHRCPSCFRPMQCNYIKNVCECPGCLQVIMQYHRAILERNEANNISDQQSDCNCGHSHYDHIGWREGSTDKRDNCRVIQCGCVCYTAANQIVDWNIKPGKIFDYKQFIVK